jgi:hypothetical protein
VLALRAALEHLQPAADGKLDRLVIAALEVQERHVLERAPVAPVERGFVPEEERGSNRLAAALGDEQRQVAGQRGADAQEEVQAEIGARAMLGVGPAVAAVEELPVPPFDRVSFQPREGNAGFAHAVTLLADLLAPLAGHAAQKGVEVRVARVAPVKLHRAAQQHAALHQRRNLFLARKEDVQRRGVPRELERRFQQQFRRISH